MMDFQHFEALIRHDLVRMLRAGVNLGLAIEA